MYFILLRWSVWNPLSSLKHMRAYSGSYAFGKFVSIYFWMASGWWEKPHTSSVMLIHQINSNNETTLFYHPNEKWSPIIFHQIPPGGVRGESYMPFEPQNKIKYVKQQGHVK